MFKTIARLESVVGSKVGHFLLEHDTSVQAARQMLAEFGTYLDQIEAQAKAQEAQKQQEKPIEAPEAPKE
jgi:hypothetical protein